MKSLKEEVKEYLQSKISNTNKSVPLCQLYSNYEEIINIISDFAEKKIEEKCKEQREICIVEILKYHKLEWNINDYLECLRNSPLSKL